MKKVNIEDINYLFNELIYTKKQELHSDTDEIAKSLRSFTIQVLETLQESINKLPHEGHTD